MKKQIPIPTAHDVFFQMFPAVSGALLGSILSIGFFVFLKMAAGGDEETPIAFSQFLLFSVIFISAITANVLSTTFMAFANNETFHGKFTVVLMHIFFTTVGLFALCSPLFLILSLESSFSLAKFFLPFTAISTALLYEVYADPENPPLAAYKGIFSGAMVAGVFALLFPTFIPNEMMAFFGLPIAWFVIPLTSAGVQGIWGLFFTNRLAQEKNTENHNTPLNL